MPRCKANWRTGNVKLSDASKATENAMSSTGKRSILRGVRDFVNGELRARPRGPGRAIRSRNSRQQPRLFSRARWRLLQARDSPRLVPRFRETVQFVRPDIVFGNFSRATPHVIEPGAITANFAQGSNDGLGIVRIGYNSAAPTDGRCEPLRKIQAQRRGPAGPPPKWNKIYSARPRLPVRASR